MATRPPAHAPPGTADGFASTEWSLVLAASAECGPSLDRLCRAYWRPVYVYVRATGVSPFEAEDATQDFFADILRRDWLKGVDQDRGSFRAFLRSSVHLFLANRYRRARARKRGADMAIPLETEPLESALADRIAHQADPAVLYDESWADCVLKAAIDRLAAEQTKTGHPEIFVQLRPFLTAPPAPGDYARLAKTLGIPPGQIAVRVHRLTQRFGEMIRAEVAATLPDRHDTESELRYLLQLTARQSG